MKKFLLGTVALAALAVPATAADMGIRPRAVAYAPGFSWTGCHIGGLAGYGWGTDDGYTTNGATRALKVGDGSVGLVAGQPVTSGFAMNGALGGGDIGCDYQFGAWVVGVEGDWEVDNKEGQAGPATSTFTSISGTTVDRSPLATFSAKERWLATARGRVGYAVDRWLLFVSGGGAWTKIDTAFFFTPSAPNGFELQGDRRSGWTVGAGVEYAPPQLNGPFNGQWTVRAEYLYVQFPSYSTLTSPVFGGTPGAGVSFPVDNGKITNNIVRFGLAYKFGGFAYAAPAVYK